jgi:thiol-disulfide isomerase/thioredoxin
MRKGVFITILITLVIVIVGGIIGYNILSREVDVPVDDQKTRKNIYGRITVQNDSDEDVVLDFEDPKKPMFINFFATWCTFCKEEIPLIEETYEKYGDDIDFVIIDLTDGTEETKDKVRQYIKDNGLEFTMYYDVYYDGLNTFGATSIPLTVCIDGNGKEVFRKTGALTPREMERIIELLSPEK